jgi:hypothetical protein
MGSRLKQSLVTKRRSGLLRLRTQVWVASQLTEAKIVLSKEALLHAWPCHSVKEGFAYLPSDAFSPDLGVLVAMGIEDDLSFEGTDSELAQGESITDDVELDVPGELGDVSFFLS